MSLLKILGTEYQPTAAFSFEFFRRDPNTKSFGPGDRIAEIFFLLPPEEYSMTEGYKINVTKTAGGGWVDDFGNDFKTLKISGSIYNYYQGYPVTHQNIESGAIAGAKNFVKNTGERVAQQGKRFAEVVANTVGQSIPGLDGLSGIEEFFKLRYIVSRFRDNYVSASGEKYRGSAPKLKEVDEIADETIGRALYDQIGIVYHDYDDNNHFEIVFTNFSVRRSKEDPFTISYSIDMTCLRLAKSIYLGVGKVVQKENPNQIINEFSNALSSVLDDLRNVANTPGQILNNFTALINGYESVSQQLIRFKDNITSDWNYFVSRLKGQEQDTLNYEELLFTSTTGNPIEDLEDETEQLDEDLLNIQKTLDDGKLILSQMKGTEKYHSIDETEKIFNLENKELTDSDFNSEGEEKQDNVFSSKTIIYYIVKQGDTLAKLGNKFYGDYEKGIIIGEANKLRNLDFENDSLLGVSISIPLEFKSPSKLLDNNLIYHKKLEQATIRERQLQILGADFKLNSNREITADGSGDIAMVYGEDCYLENIDDRLSFPVGTLSPLHPEWGLQVGLGNVPTSVAIDRIFDDIERQINADPRTQKGFIDIKKADLREDVLNIPLHLKPFTGSEKVINAKDIVAGVLTQ